MNGSLATAVGMAAAAAVLLFANAVLDRSAAVFGLMAATIAIGAFVGRASAVLSDRGEREVQRATMYWGVGLAALSVAAAPSSSTSWTPPAPCPRWF